MPARNADTWLIVPLYNEAPVVRDVVRQARETFSNIVCVDDGSHDQSVAEAIAGGAIVKHPINLGQGAALQTGITYALRPPHAQYFVTFDADGQHQDEMPRRWSRGSARTEPRTSSSARGSWMVEARSGASEDSCSSSRCSIEQVSTGVQLTDTHNGLRALNRTGRDAA